MNNKLFGILMFAVGAAVGSAVTWKLVKTKYEQIAQEEIDSVREEYLNLTRSMRTKNRENATAVYEGPNDADEARTLEHRTDEREVERVEYHKIARNYRSSNDDLDDEGNNEEGGNRDKNEVPYINGPRVISPEEFNNAPPGYSAQPLDYFADGVLADSWGVKLDIDETIGEESLDHFGEYQDDILHVRNEREEVDYEITRDPRTYDEAVRTNPNPYYGR